MLSGDITEIIEDGRLVALYGMRSGRLAEAPALVKAISDLEAKAVAGADATSEIQQLVGQLTASVAKIAPITLIDLRHRRDPFDPAYQPKLRGLQVWFSIVSILLLILSGSFSIYASQKTEAVAAIADATSAHAQERYVKVWNLHKKSPKNGGTSVPANEDILEQQLSDLRELDRKLSITFYTVTQAVQTGNWLLQYIGPSTSAGGSEEYEQSTACQGEKEKSLDISAVSGIESEKKYDTSSEEPGCFFFSRSFSFNPTRIPEYTQEINLLKRQLTILNAWAIPLLYGMLGACLFCTRNFMDVQTVNPDALSAAARVLMGGVAGIVIGWLWGAVPIRGIEIANLSNPAILAFLAGYGIEILFSLLDRVNKSIIAVISTPPKSSLG